VAVITIASTVGQDSDSLETPREDLYLRRIQAPVPVDKSLDWLLEPANPSVRYLALTELQGQREYDPKVRQARAAIPDDPWVRTMLQRRNPGGWWVRDKGWLEPRFTGTHWNMLALADLGASRDIPEVEKSAEFWMAKSPLVGGGVGGFGKGKGHHCYTANMARALIRLGYSDDERVRRTMEWLVKTAHPKGGWTCRFSKEGPAPSRTLDAWEGLAAFAVYPRKKWSGEMQAVVEKTAEYYLEHELHQQGERYEPWYDFHWPIHYYYDVLVGLDCLTALGYGRDRRLTFALDLLKSKRRSDGRWNLDAIYPEMTPEAVAWYKKHRETHPPTPLAFEEKGRASKMITLRARTILARLS